MYREKAQFCYRLDSVAMYHWTVLHCMFYICSLLLREKKSVIEFDISLDDISLLVNIVEYNHSWIAE